MTDTPVSRAEFDALKQQAADNADSLSKIHAALPALFAFRDNFVLWAKETGVEDRLVQEVLATANVAGMQKQIDAANAFYSDLVGKLTNRVVALESAPSSGSVVSSGSAVDVAGFLAAFGIKIGAAVHAPLIIESKNGVGIYLQSDTDNTTGQREGGTYPQWFGISISGDGGGGLFQNIVYPEDGSPAYIPDPSRMATTWRIDRMGAMSVDVMTAGKEFAPGRWEAISLLGQCFVFLADVAGNMVFRMPQENTALYVEQGFGGNPSHVDANGNLQGHRETKFRRRVALEGGW